MTSPRPDFRNHRRGSTRPAGSYGCDWRGTPRTGHDHRIKRHDHEPEHAPGQRRHEAGDHGKAHEGHGHRHRPGPRPCGAAGSGRTLRCSRIRPATTAPRPSRAARLNTFDPMTTPAPSRCWPPATAVTAAVTSGASAASAATMPSSASERLQPLTHPLKAGDQDPACRQADQRPRPGTPAPRPRPSCRSILAARPGTPHGHALNGPSRPLAHLGSHASEGADQSFPARREPAYRPQHRPRLRQRTR